MHCVWTGTGLTYRIAEVTELVHEAQQGSIQMQVTLRKPAGEHTKFKADFQMCLVGVSAHTYPVLADFA